MTPPTAFVIVRLRLILPSASVACQSMSQSSTKLLKGENAAPASAMDSSKVGGRKAMFWSSFCRLGLRVLLLHGGSPAHAVATGNSALHPSIYLRSLELVRDAPKWV